MAVSSPRMICQFEVYSFVVGLHNSCIQQAVSEFWNFRKKNMYGFLNEKIIYSRRWTPTHAKNWSMISKLKRKMNGTHTRIRNKIKADFGARDKLCNNAKIEEKLSFLVFALKKSARKSMSLFFMRASILPEIEWIIWQLQKVLHISSTHFLDAYNYKSLYSSWKLITRRFRLHFQDGKCSVEHAVNMHIRP